MSSQISSLSLHSSLLSLLRLPFAVTSLHVGIVANLIVRKYVKGYISHKLKVLVVHKTQPFPSLDSVVLVDE